MLYLICRVSFLNGTCCILIRYLLCVGTREIGQYRPVANLVFQLGRAPRRAGLGAVHWCVVRRCCVYVAVAFTCAGRPVVLILRGQLVIVDLC